MASILIPTLTGLGGVGVGSLVTKFIEDKEIEKIKQEYRNVIVEKDKTMAD